MKGSGAARRLTRVVASACVIALPTACASHGSGAPVLAPLRSAARDSLLAADLARGVVTSERGMLAGATTWLDSGAIYLRAGAPIVAGRTAAAAIAAAGRADSALYRWQPLGGGISRDSSAGYTYGVAATVSRESGTAALALARYLAFWRRAADGIWRIAAYAEVQGSGMPADAQSAASDLVAARPMPRGPRATAIRQVRDADSAFALAADLQGAGDAFSSFVAPTGSVFTGSELVTGSAAVKEVFDALQRGGGTLNWRPVYADAATSGDIGFTIGESVFTGRGPTGAAVQRFGKYLTIWVRQANGSWRFAIDGGNASPTPTR